MEINKERVAFEAWYEQHHNGRQIACDYVEEDNSYSVGYANAIWVGWQAAKATPEGLVLMPIKPTETMVMAVAKEHEGDAFLPYSLYDAFVKQALIEAQE